MHRYPRPALEAWEHATALAGTLAEPKPAAAPAPVAITLPAPGRPGRKPADDERGGVRLHRAVH